MGSTINGFFGPGDAELVRRALVVEAARERAGLEWIEADARRSGNSDLLRCVADCRSRAERLEAIAARIGDGK
jgi:hypothetical protein